MFVGSFVIAWYEGAWGPDYYLETYGSGLLASFWSMISICRRGGLAGTTLCIVLHVIGRKTDALP
ncbi:hypothetical protein D3Z38_19355 [Clostridiales bacterium]|nr:hypothetical protein [Clostridiales bacterium]